MRHERIESKEVIVLCYGGLRARVIVFRDLGDVLLVCSPEERRVAYIEKREPLTVGFKRESVLAVSA